MTNATTSINDHANWILEACYIMQLNPTLNDQVDSDILILFRHGVT